MKHDSNPDDRRPRMRIKKNTGLLSISVEFCATRKDGTPDYSKDMGGMGLYDGMLVEAYIDRLKQTIRKLEQTETDIFVSP